MAPTAPIAAHFGDGPAFLRAAAESLAQLPDTAEPETGEFLLHAYYGIKAALTTLSSEVERTCVATLADGQRLILKTSNRLSACDCGATFKVRAARRSG